jgi:PKD repeat protein
MKTIIKIITVLKLILQVVLVSLMAFSMSSCDPTIDSLKFDLPEANSIPDLTPPSANFVETQTAEDWQTYTFANLSSSATTYAWDFGDGQSATTLDATNTFPGEGEFTVSLTASDDLGVSNTFTKVIEVVEPEVPAAIIPIIGAPDFEDVAGVCGSGDSRDCWRLSGASIHQTTSDGRNGSRGAKYPVSASSQRVTYQGITVHQTQNIHLEVIMHYKVLAIIFAFQL